MRYRTATFGTSALLVAALLSGCTPEPNGPRVERPEPTSQQSGEASEENPTPTPGTIPNCRNAKSAEWKMRHEAPPFKTSSVGDIEMRVTPIFAGNPDVSDIRLENGINGDAQVRKWTSDVDTNRVLLTVMTDASKPHSKIENEDLGSLRVRKAPVDGGSEHGGCGEQVEVETRFIGTHTNEEGGNPSSMWEVSSKDDIAMDAEGLFTALVGGTQLQQLGAARVHEGGDVIYASMGDTPESRADLAYYYDHR
jgi:hypothetical protein